MDLGHQRGVDQARLVEQPLIRLARVVGLEHVGNGVVLQGEQVVHHAQPHPPVFIEAGDGFTAEEFRGQAAVAVHFQLAVHERAHFVVGVLVAAVELGAIPPVGVDVLVGNDGFIAADVRVRAGTLHGHGAIAQHIARRQREFNRVGLGAGTVVEPVVHHELNPGGGDKVQGGSRLEITATGHDQVTDFPRVGGQQVATGVFRIHRCRVYVAAEVGVGGAFRRIVENITGAVFGTGGETAFVTDNAGILFVPAFHVEHVVFEQVFPLPSQYQQRTHNAQGAEFGEGRPGNPGGHSHDKPPSFVLGYVG